MFAFENAKWSDVTGSSGKVAPLKGAAYVENCHPVQDAYGSF